MLVTILLGGCFDAVEFVARFAARGVLTVGLMTNFESSQDQQQDVALLLAQG
jgi:hypothetical protein